MTEAKRESLPSGYRRMFAFVLPYWRRLVLVLVLSVISTSVTLSQPYITKLLIDEALLSRNLRTLVEIAALMVAATATGFVLNILSSYRYIAVSADVLFDMRLVVYRHLQSLSPRFFARTRLGEIVSRLNNDIGEVQRVAADTLLAVVSNLIFLAGSVILMCLLNWKLFFVSILLLPLSIFALRHYGARLADRVQKVRERSSEIGSFIIETLMGVRLVVSSNAQEREVSRFRDKNQSFISAMLSMHLTSFLANALPGTLLTLSTAIVFLYGGKLVIEGDMTLGEMVAFMAYHMRLLAPVQSLMSLYTNLMAGRVSLNRVFEILDTPVEVADSPQAINIESVRGDIVFDNVTMKYDRDVVVLDSVTFSVPDGSVCTISGPSGVGKSTIADLLVRFYDPTFGTVRLDGHDLRSLRLADIRREVVLVEQNPFLFNATIIENIRYARPDASFEEIVRAARAASIDEFIQSLPLGYDTQVGERGQTLSAGERQRIALARTLLRNPSVIVLDEPTAWLDPITENSLATMLSTALRGRTILIISHRLSLVKSADWAIMIDEGRVVESGRPDELLARNSLLSSFFSADQPAPVL